MIHPIGWSTHVGHKINNSCESTNPLVAPAHCFKTPEHVSLEGIEEGMVLEAVDPLNLATICAASIAKVKSTVSNLVVLGLI